MKHVKLLIACLLALCVVLPGVAAADTLDDILERGTLRVGMEPGYMPFEMTNKKGEIIGFDVDMAKRIAKAMGVKLELVSTAWDGIIPALITKKFDMIMSGMTLTQERNMKIGFAKPYIVIGQSILIDKKLAGEIKSYKDLNNKKYKVASKLGTTGEQATKRMIPNCEYISFTICLSTPLHLLKKARRNLSFSTSLSPMSLWLGPLTRATPTSSTGWTTS
jgi:polar amino acid transport system substrate-binding protein